MPARANRCVTMALSRCPWRRGMCQTLRRAPGIPPQWHIAAHGYTLPAAAVSATLGPPYPPRMSPGRVRRRVADIDEAHAWQARSGNR